MTAFAKAFLKTSI